MKFYLIYVFSTFVLTTVVMSIWGNDSSHDNRCITSTWIRKNRLKTNCDIKRATIEDGYEVHVKKPIFKIDLQKAIRNNELEIFGDNYLGHFCTTMVDGVWNELPKDLNMEGIGQFLATCIEEETYTLTVQNMEMEYLNNVLTFTFGNIDNIPETITLDRNECEMAENSVRYACSEIPLLAKKLNNKFLRLLACNTVEWIQNEQLKTNCHVYETKMKDGRKEYEVILKEATFAINIQQAINDGHMEIFGDDYLGYFCTGYVNGKMNELNKYDDNFNNLEKITQFLALCIEYSVYKRKITNLEFKYSRNVAKFKLSDVHHIPANIHQRGNQCEQYKNSVTYACLKIPQLAKKYPKVKTGFHIFNKPKAIWKAFHKAKWFSKKSKILK